MGTRSILALAVAGLVAAGCGEDPRPERVNVLLISLDSTRRDLLSAYGRVPRHAPGERTSPHLDRLAAGGVLFEDASATSSWTLPSHVALFTGEPELVHRVDLDGQRASEELPFLAEVLREHGYRTAGFASAPYLDPAFGFDRGFERYEMLYGPELAEAQAVARRSAAGVDEGSGPGAIAGIVEASQALELASQQDRSADVVSEAVVAELERCAAQGDPFFVFAHYFDPHYDYLPPAPDDARFDPAYSGAMTGERFYFREDVATFEEDGSRRRTVNDRDLEHLLALYEGELAATDAAIGRVLERLDALGLAEDTLVVVVADHGDEFFEHGGIGHRRTLFEEVLRVPLILRLPGRLPAGRRVAGSVPLTSVAPTILHLSGVSSRPASLVPLMMDRAGDPVDASILARLVSIGPHTEEVPIGSRVYEVACTLLTVEETWRRGALKITRVVRWPRAAEQLPPALAAALEERAREMRARETLRWIDLEAHPGEPVEAHAAEFDDPRARAALEAFRQEYEELQARALAPELDEVSAGVADVLRGLGYVDGPAHQGVLPADELRLPPPGLDVPGLER
jgi:arylsulfatase A-like enzyme